MGAGRGLAAVLRFGRGRRPSGPVGEPRGLARMAARAEARRIVAGLPPYQVALWPDGWEPLGDGGVRLRDTDAMAEARRWYGLAERNRAAVPSERAMRLHGTYVPRAILDLSGLRFASNEAASVAVQLVAGDWVRQRRDRLLAAPSSALRERELTWSGSRSGESLDCGALAEILARLLDQCMGEGLIPPVRCRLRVRADDGFGIPGFRCILEIALDPYARNRLVDCLAAVLVPWNRVVVRDGRAYPIIGLEARGPRAAA